MVFILKNGVRTFKKKILREIFGSETGKEKEELRCINNLYNMYFTPNANRINFWDMNLIRRVERAA